MARSHIAREQKRVCVTGAGGFLLLQILKQEKHYVIAVDRKQRHGFMKESGICDAFAVLDLHSFRMPWTKG
eukprot:5696014-Amphidinium_carterae.1